MSGNDFSRRPHGQAANLQDNLSTTTATSAAAAAPSPIATNSSPTSDAASNQEAFIDSLLADIYYDPAHPASLAGVNKLRQAANEQLQKLQPFKNEIKKLTSSRVSRWLHSQDVYTRHKRAIRNFKRNPIVAFHVDANWQLDLADVKSTSRSNSGVKYILVAIDVLSRYAWTRGLRSKETTAVRDALADIVDKDGRKPMLITADSGKEFTSRPFKAFVNDTLCAHLWFTPPGKKASIAERFIQTLKSKIVKYYAWTGGRKRFIHKLQDFTHAYNHSLHRMLRMKPADVTKSNEHEAFNNLYGKYYTRKAVAEPPVNDPNSSLLKSLKGPIHVTRAQERPADRVLREGDRVRIAIHKDVFSKGYTPRFSQKTYTIRRKSHDRPPFVLYTLVDDADGKELESRKYAQELVPVTDKNQQ